MSTATSIATCRITAIIIVIRMRDNPTIFPNSLTDNTIAVSHATNAIGDVIFTNFACVNAIIAFIVSPMHSAYNNCTLFHFLLLLLFK